MDGWDDTAKVVAHFLAEVDRLDKAIEELESAVLCMKLTLSVIEARNGRVHESAN